MAQTGEGVLAVAAEERVLTCARRVRRSRVDGLVVRRKRHKTPRRKMK